jgi:protein-disulfide isomerase
MSSDRPTKAQRREEARQQALRLRQEQERARRRRRTLAIAASVALGVAFLVLVWFILSQPGADDVPEAEQVQPTFAADGGGGIVMDATGVVTPPADADAEWPVGAFGDAVVVTVYSDPICPWCAVFEALATPVLEEMRLAGDVVLDHRFVGNLDNASQGTRYSTRAAQAVYTVAELDPDAVLDFVRALYEAQPAEGTPGLSDEEIQEVARAAGVSDEAVEAIPERRFMWWVGEVTTAAKELYGGRLATPSVRLNGEPLGDGVDWRVESQLRAAIEAARG